MCWFGFVWLVLPPLAVLWAWTLAWAQALTRIHRRKETWNGMRWRYAISKRETKTKSETVFNGLFSVKICSRSPEGAPKGASTLPWLK